MFTIEDIGCWGDASFGHQHCREKLAEILGSFGNESTEDIRKSLLEPMPDDAWDESDALDWINENLCEDGVQFVFCYGDLLLVGEDFEE